MTYENPKIVKSWDSIPEPPFMIHMEDRDGEVLELEYNLDGDIIFRIHNKGGSSPCFPTLKVMNTLLELNEKGMNHESQFDGFEGDVYKRD